MELPRADLPKADRSMQPPVWSRTLQVTGDSFDKPNAPAAAPLVASTSSTPPPVSEAVLAPSTSEVLPKTPKPSDVLQQPPKPSEVLQLLPKPSDNPRQTYREFYNETSNALSAVFSSLLDDSDAEEPMPPPPPPLPEALPGTSSSSQARSEALAEAFFNAAQNRSKISPGGLSGLVFTEAVHRMLKHLALTQWFASTEWLTLLQIFTENGGNGASRFYDVKVITIIRDYAVVRPDHQPDIWFNLHDGNSRRALKYFVRLSTQYGWWTCRYINVLQTPTHQAAITIARILRRLRPSLHGITFPQTHDFWYSQRDTSRRQIISKQFTWLPIDQAARQYVRGVSCIATYLLQSDYWTQSHLVRAYFDGCSSYTCPLADKHMAVFSFYRDLPPSPETTPQHDPPKATQFQYPFLATADDFVLQANVAWPSNFFAFWKNFGNHYTILDIRAFARCFPTPSPREFLLMLMGRIQKWPSLRHVQIEFRYTDEAHPGGSQPLLDQAIEFAVITNIRCQDLRGALFDQEPPLPSELRLVAEYDCWHATAAELQQTAYAFRRTFEAPQQQVWITQRCDASYVIGTSWLGPNYRLELRVYLRAIGISYAPPRQPFDLKALRARLEKLLEQDSFNA